MVSVKRPEVANRIHDAKEHGDLSENAEYEDAKNEQAFVEGRIQTLEALIKNATIIDENHSTDHVQIGSTVAVESPRRQGSVHDRRLGRGQAGRGPDLQREPGRARAARQEEGREGRRQGPGRRLHLQDRRDQPEAAPEVAMDWADELAARVSGPQVVNDSKTPSGTVHVGSLRGPVILDVIARALRANGHRDDAAVRRRRPRPDGRPGAPDARRDRPRDGPAAGPRARPGRRLPLELRPPFRRACSSTSFAGLGIHPDRYYWMSDIYPTGAMDPYIRLALDRAALVREIYRRVANVQHPDTWHPLGVICPTCGKVGTTIVTDWDGERVFFECRPDLVTWARGCGTSGWISPFGGARQAALEPRVGGPVVALRGDDRAGRQGPLDRRRVARPERRDRARGVRARAAAQRPVRVPQHRRQEDVDVQGPRRGRAHDRRGRAAGAAPLPVPASPPEPGDRVRAGRHRRGPAPVRRVRPVRRRDRRPRGQGRDRAGLRGDVPLRAARPERGRDRRGSGVPAGLRPPGAARPDPGRRRRRPGRGREGRAR